ncbi:30S ribosomal protein S2 [Candidatus Gottesmanbacteria bacterium]|nr:30S ribosomal protein S2 [Candidatus Gottesmanbacteria bacterium]
MDEIALKALLEAGCHFGHKVDRWHPKASPFIYQAREGIHVIDLAQTKAGLTRAAQFVKALTLKGGMVLFLGTKRQASSVIKEESVRVGVPFISHRWIGGFFTNWEQVRKNLEKIRRLEEEEKSGAWKKYPKHERIKLMRYLRRLHEFYGGVANITALPDAIVVVDINREKVAVNEAVKMNIPVIAIVDTNSDPTPISYPIPANDDAVGSIKLLVSYLADACHEGKLQAEKNQAAKDKEKGAPTQVESIETQVKIDTVKPVKPKEVKDKKGDALNKKTRKPTMKKETVEKIKTAV